MVKVLKKFSSVSYFTSARASSISLGSSMSRHGSFRFDGGSSAGCSFGFFRYATKLGSSLFGHTLRQTIMFMVYVSRIRRTDLYFEFYTHSRMKENKAAPKQKDVRPKIAVDTLKQIIEDIYQPILGQHHIYLILFHNFITWTCCTRYTPCEQSNHESYCQSPASDVLHDIVGHVCATEAHLGGRVDMSHYIKIISFNMILSRTSDHLIW